MQLYYFTLTFFTILLIYYKLNIIIENTRLSEPMHTQLTPNRIKYQHPKISKTKVKSENNTLYNLDLKNTSKNTHKMALYRKCEKYGVSGTLKDVLENHNIERVACPCSDKKCSHACEKDWTIYLPCGYNNIEKELGRVKVHNQKQIIFGITGCDQIVSKNSLWTLIILKYGRKKASQLMPNTYLIYKPSDMKLFQHTYNPQKVYILKKNVQRQTGLKITNNLREIMSLQRDSDFKLVQELLMDPFVLNKRKINLRIYLLIVCHGKKRYAFIHKRGFMYYTPNFFVKNTLEKDINITSGYVSREVYEENPLTLTDFKKWLEQNGYSSNKCFHNIKHLFYEIMEAISWPLCEMKSLKKNTTFQLFGADVAPDENLGSRLIELNKGPDMGAKGHRDKELKRKVQEDVFDLLNVIKSQKKNEFQLIWKN